MVAIVVVVGNDNGIHQFESSGEIVKGILLIIAAVVTTIDLAVIRMRSCILVVLFSK